MVEASLTLAILQTLGVGRWNGSARKYGAMCAQQLFHVRVLAVLAQEFQFMDCAVSDHKKLRDFGD